MDELRLDTISLSGLLSVGLNCVMPTKLLLGDCGDDVFFVWHWGDNNISDALNLFIKKGCKLAEFAGRN